MINEQIMNRTDFTYFLQDLDLETRKERYTVDKYNPERGYSMVKIYVLDTNVLIQAPYAAECFEDNQVVLPMAEMTTMFRSPS